MGCAPADSPRHALPGGPGTRYCWYRLYCIYRTPDNIGEENGTRIDQVLIMKSDAVPPKWLEQPAGTRDCDLGTDVIT